VWFFKKAGSTSFLKKRSKKLLFPEVEAAWASVRLPGGL
jgi:hypothetical protein